MVSQSEHSKATKRIRTALYGDQRVSPAELEVLHTPAMQRLYGLHQLGFTDRVFIDASHARIHHVVGVLHQAEKLVEAVCSSLTRAPAAQLRYGTDSRSDSITHQKLADHAKDWIPVIRFIGLLHDLTHAPFGHTLEDEIGLVGTKHDEPRRQADAFYRLLCQLVAWLGFELVGHDSSDWPANLVHCLSCGDSGAQESLVELPDPGAVGKFADGLLRQAVEAQRASWRLSKEGAAAMLAHLGCAMTALLHLESLHKPRLAESDLPQRTGEYPFQTLVRTALSSPEFGGLLSKFSFVPARDAFVLDIIGNTVCADLLDYAKRDSYLAGLRLDFDPDRIAENFTVVSHDTWAYEKDHRADGDGAEARVPEGRDDPFAGWCLRTAISLVSHKFRTDVPSELMNLLNVRYYLYERVVFHPTKCAAGAMLGTALQLAGWGERGGAPQPQTLPAHLRFVGDEVFLHDMRAGLALAVERLGHVKTDKVEARDVPDGDLNRAHSGLASELVQLRVGKSTAVAVRELRAAKLLLDRLASRRFYRPVWRALPSTSEPRLNLHSESLAGVFRSPGRRYAAERKIEELADLPVGTVTIHCPSRKTARKVANVLLTMPDENLRPLVARLRDIATLDPVTFGDHQKALRAVQEMYGSMWRMNVYLAPEHMQKYKKIAKITGEVVFRAMDAHGHFVEDEAAWPCDPTLEEELKAKFAGEQVRSPTAAGRTPRTVETGTLAASRAQGGVAGRPGPESSPTADGPVRGEPLRRLLALIQKRGLTPNFEYSKTSFSTWLSQGQPADFEVAFRIYREWESGFYQGASTAEAETVRSQSDPRTQRIEIGGWQWLYDRAVRGPDGGTLF